MPEFKAGVFWVGLAPLATRRSSPTTIAQTLGAKDGLADHIGERELLLLLDNLEQVVEAAPELAALVEACPNLRLLVTSRELLRVRGEVEYPVLPLAEPDAVELFCARARARAGRDRPRSSAARSTTCRSRSSWPPPGRASSRPSRSSSGSPDGSTCSRAAATPIRARQTLRATIEWSHELLSPEEQRCFARLSVFRGGCTLEAAEEVAEADLDTLAVARRQEPPPPHASDRFWMLETIREYAAERLEESGEADELRRRHAEHFLALAEEAEPHLRGEPQGVARPAGARARQPPRRTRPARGLRREPACLAAGRSRCLASGT